MGFKEDNKGINSGVLLSSVIIDYMIIRVKEKESGEEKWKEPRENERETDNEEDNKGIGEVACLITILRWR